MEPGGENNLENQPDNKPIMDDDLDGAAAPSADSLHASSFDDAENESVETEDAPEKTEAAEPEEIVDEVEEVAVETEADQIDALADELVSTLATEAEATEAEAAEAETAEAAEPETEPETEPVTEPETELITEPDTEPIAYEEVAAPETEPGTEPEPETEPVTEPETEPTTEPEPETEPTTEPETAPEEIKVEPVAEPKTPEPAEEPTTEPETEPAVEAVSAEPTEETLVADAIVTPPPKPPKRKSPVVTFLMVLLIIALLGAVAFAFYVVIAMPSLSNKTLDETPTPTSAETAEESLTCTYIASINEESNATNGVSSRSGLKAQHNQATMNFTGGNLVDASLKTVYTYSSSSAASKSAKELEDTYKRTYTAVGLKSDPFTSSFTSKDEVATKTFYATIDQLNQTTAPLIDFPVTGKNNPKTTSSDLEEHYTKNGYTCNFDKKHQKLSDEES